MNFYIIDILSSDEDEQKQILCKYDILVKVHKIAN